MHIFLRGLGGLGTILCNIFLSGSGTILCNILLSGSGMKVEIVRFESEDSQV